MNGAQSETWGSLSLRRARQQETEYHTNDRMYGMW